MTYENNTATTEATNREKLKGVAKGQRINFRYGRAERGRVVTGEVTFVRASGKGKCQVAVRVGEGLDTVVLGIPATALVFEGA